jgi:hypothetical protein
VGPSYVSPLTGVTREMAEGKPIYWYSAPPGPVTIKGLSVTQKGKTFYLAKGSAVDLDRISRVPVIPYSQDNDQIASWVLSAANDKWQRTLDPERIKDIDVFFRRARNFIVNSTVVSLPVTATQISEVGDVAEIKVPVTWPVKKCPNAACAYAPAKGEPHFGETFDSCPKCEWDGRPAVIVDGQHRIRGSALSGPMHWAQPLVATILLDNQFSQADMARIFTEITTSAVDLDDLHKLFLLYRFELRAPRNIGQVKDADFTQLPPAPPQKNTTGMRNRRAYEIVCLLVSDRTSRWHNRITMLPTEAGSARRGDVMDADRALAYIEEWLRSGKVLADPRQVDGMIPRAQCIQYLQDYMEVVLATWPKGLGTPIGSSTWWWKDLRASNGVLQQRGIFEVFLQLFPVIVERIQKLHVSVTKSSIQDQMSLLEELDWNDPAWSELGTPDKNKNMLLGVLTHLFEVSPNPVGKVRIQAWINNWIKGSPDAFAFTKVPPPASQLRSASKRAPLRFEWQSKSPVTGRATPRPVNAYETAAVTLSQVQAGRPVTLDESMVSSNILELTAVPVDLETGPRAAVVTVQIAYTHGNLATVITHDLSP